MTGRIAEVSAFEAKTRLSELLRETERGKSFVILRRGKPVARLIPPDDKGAASDLGKILEAFREIRKQIPGTLEIRKLVEQGRRF